jgi:hypothetical protein
MPRKDIVDRIEKYVRPFRITKGKNLRLKDFAPDDTCGLKLDKGEATRTAPTRHSVARRRAGNARHILAFFNKLPPCLVGVEACASSRLPPAYVKPYVKRQKNETADAEAICKAVS